MRPRFAARLAAAVTLTLAAAGLQGIIGTAAQAAFPGTNGKIYYFDESDGEHEIYSMNPDTTGVVKLTDNASLDLLAVASADGKKVAFVSDRTGAFEVWSMNADGTGQTQVTVAGVGFNPFVGPSALSWSPTGQIYYSDPSTALVAVNPDGTGATPLGVSGLDPAVSPDGSKVAYAVPAGPTFELWVVNANGTNPTLLASYGFLEGPFHPEWSPDGTRIAITRFAFFTYSVSVLDADGTNEVQVASGPTQLLPQWSPDGTMIVYTDFADFTLHTINPDGTGHALLYTLPACGFGSDWAVVPSGPVYTFLGFFQPVDNLPTVNTMNAGRAVPIKFSLDGDQGLDIFAAGYPKSQQITCGSGDLVDGVEETVTAGGSTLQYDPVTDSYSYVWKTDKAWKNTCRQLVVKLADGTYHRATFSLT